MVLRSGRYGKFLASVNYPQVKCVVNLDKKEQIKYPAPPPVEVVSEPDPPKPEAKPQPPPPQDEVTDYEPVFEPRPDLGNAIRNRQELRRLGVENAFHAPPQHGRQFVSAAHDEARNANHGGTDDFALQRDAVLIAAVQVQYRIDSGE